MKDKEKEFDYLIESYKTAIGFFGGYFDRVYNRFNILIGIDVALAGVYAGVLFDIQSPTDNRKILILSLGLIVSLLLYVQSAQDRFVVKRLRESVNKIRGLIEEQIGRNDIPALFSPLDGIESRKRKFMFEDLTSWRSNFISLSRIPPITSLVFVIFWIVAFFITK